MLSVVMLNVALPLADALPAPGLFTLLCTALTPTILANLVRFQNVLFDFRRPRQFHFRVRHFGL